MNSFLKPKNADYIIALLAYFLIALSILGAIIFSPGTVGFYHDWFLGPYPEMIHLFASSGFYIWDSQEGNKVYPTDWIFRIGLYPFSFLGGEVLSKGLLIIIITLSGFSAFCLGKQFELSPIACFAAGVLYIFSPIIFTRIVAGYIYYLIAYLLAPLILANFLKGKVENRNKYFIIAGLLLSIAIIQIQFLIMILGILLIFSLVDFRSIKKSTRGLLITFSIGFLINLSPVVFSQTFVTTPESPININSLFSYHEIISAPDLLQSFRLLGYDTHLYSYVNLSKDGIIPPWILYLDFSVPIVGFSCLIFVRKNKYVFSFAIIAIIGLFLLKGLNQPFPGIFSFFFTHGFYIFREIWHIAFLYGFSLTFLTAFLLEKIKSYNLINFFKFPLFLILILLVVISNGYPMLMANFGGYLQTYDFPADYHAIYKNNSSDTTYNTLVLPFVRPIQYNSSELEGIDPIARYWSNSILPINFDNRFPTTSFSAWLLSVMQQNKTDTLGKLLSGFGIKYIISRNDFVSKFPDYILLGSDPLFRARWYTSLEPFLDAQKDLVVISNTTQYKIYENLNKAEKIFLPKILAGGLSDFNSLLSISNFTSLSNIAAYRSINDKEALTFADNMQETKIPFDDFLELGMYANSSGWIDNRNLFGYNYFLASRIPQGAFSSLEGSVLSVELPSKYAEKPIEIWLKALMWNKGGKIKININGEQSFNSSLFSTNQSFQISKIYEGRASNPFRLSIENINGENYVEGIYTKEVTETETQGYLNNTDKTFVIGIEDQRSRNLVQNPEFVLYDNYSGFPSYWNDWWKGCRGPQKQESVPLATLRHAGFICAVNSTTGWQDNTSFEVSTKSTANNTWSAIRGKEIDVNPNERYELVTHMRLNEFALQSHIAIEAFDEIQTGEWYTLEQCPPGTNGPREWQVSNCEIKIPANTTKIRPVLNAGWSSQQNREAVTFFDAVFVEEINNDQKAFSFSKITDARVNESSSQKSVINEYSKVNPTLWNTRINASEPFILAFAEPFDQAWEASVYKSGKKVELAKSAPMYDSINSFQINQTGQLEIVIKYIRQDWFEIGVLVSAVTFSFCMFYIFYNWIRMRKGL